jgi:hypothetical protein
MGNQIEGAASGSNQVSIVTVDPSNAGRHPK